MCRAGVARRVPISRGASSGAYVGLVGLIALVGLVGSIWDLSNACVRAIYLHFEGLTFLLHLCEFNFA